MFNIFTLFFHVYFSNKNQGGFTVVWKMETVEELQCYQVMLSLILKESFWLGMIFLESKEKRIIH